MGLMGLAMACHGGLWGIVTGLTKSTDHPSDVARASGPVFKNAGSTLSRKNRWSQIVLRQRKEAERRVSLKTSRLKLRSIVLSYSIILSYEP